MKLAFHPRWPSTLFARLTLILLLGLVLAQILSFSLTLYERDAAAANMMVGYIDREVTSSVALLDHLPPKERAEWLPRLARRSYSFMLGPGAAPMRSDTPPSTAVVATIAAALGDRYPTTVNTVS